MKIFFIGFLLTACPLGPKMIILVSLNLILIFNLAARMIIRGGRLFHTDLISISLLMLTFFLIGLMVISQFNCDYSGYLWFVNMVLTLRLVFTFLGKNVLMFYFFFEWSLIPIFMIIMGWGYQIERLKASIYILFYTLFASLPLLLILLLFNKFNGSLLIRRLMLNSSIVHISWLLATFSFFAFLVKFPIYGVHQWLPKAHVEAPVRGSMVLAGVLLKLGGYGIIRLGYTFYPVNPMHVFMVISLLGGGLLAIVCCGVRDLKVIIAYSSVVHMAFIIVGILSTMMWGILGAMIIIIAHGLCSSGMFSNANMLYERSHSRAIMLNKGVLSFYPRISLLWFLLCIANFGGPFTFNLLAEIILIVNISRVNTILLASVGLVSLFSAAYSLILYSRTQQGAPSCFYYSCSNVPLREISILIFHLIPLLLIAASPVLI